MNKLPAKQIYLLTIIIVGIIALSVYSTYALFTLETETSDIVTIYTPKSLTISENIYEYQQLTIEPNTIATTDIDINNAYEYDVCYSVWYKIIEENIDINKVQIFQNNSKTLTSSGVLTSSNSIRVTITIINDNKEPVKINLGTIGSQKENNSCSLNLDEDKNLINEVYENIEILNTKILENKDNKTKSESNYITYQNERDKITYKNTDKIYISDKFNYNNELFTLEEPLYLTMQEIAERKYIKNDEEIKIEFENIYFCKEDSKCTILYKINELIQEEIDKPEATLETPSEEETIEFEYYITKYNKLIGYMEGTNGLRKINQKDYVFYGDNPNNYIYYNCETNNISTCELWRIIGFFYDEETQKYNTKIIREQSIGKYPINQVEEESPKEEIELTWETSTLNKYLNEEYKLINNSELIIETNKQQLETLTSLEDTIKILDNKIEDNTTENVEESEIENKISILSLSDYINASTCEKEKLNEYNEVCLKNNWLNNIEIEKEWTLTQKEIIEVEEETTNEEQTEPIEENNDNQENHTTEETTTETPEETNEEINQTENNLTQTPNEPEQLEETEKEIINYAYWVGNEINEGNVIDLLDIRPVVYLKSRMLLVSGDGTFTSPYVLK